MSPAASLRSVEGALNQKWQADMEDSGQNRPLGDLYRGWRRNIPFVPPKGFPWWYLVWPEYGIHFSTSQKRLKQAIDTLNQTRPEWNQSIWRLIGFPSLGLFVGFFLCKAIYMQIEIRGCSADRDVDNAYAPASASWYYDWRKLNGVHINAYGKHVTIRLKGVDTNDLQEGQLALMAPETIGVLHWHYGLGC